MRCPTCGKAELMHDTRDTPFAYKGQTTIIPAVTADFCSVCHEYLTGPGETDRVMEIMGTFMKQVNATLTDPGLISRIRKKLALDQRQAAEIFGGGVNAFSRYETGKAVPPVALVKLLKILDRHPDLLDEVRAA